MTNPTTSNLNDSAQEQGSAEPKNQLDHLQFLANPFVSKVSRRDSEKFTNLPPSDGGCIMNLTLHNSKPSTSLQVRNHCSLSSGRTNVSSSSRLSPSPHSTTESLCNIEQCLQFQQSLLVLIHLHLLQRLLKTSTKVIIGRCTLFYRYGGPFRHLKENLPTFFKNVGYVSNLFLESALLAAKVFFQINTFPIVSEDLSQLSLLSSFYGADLSSVYMHVLTDSFDVEEFSNYSHLISGLELELKNHDGLDFLYKCSEFFPRLKKLHVTVHATVFMEFIDVFNVNDIMTSVTVRPLSIGPQGAVALADVLGTNSTLTSLDLSDNFIDVEGAIALADALKVNTSVTSINLSRNSIGDEGARAMADVLKVNVNVTKINLGRNRITQKRLKHCQLQLKT
ncbi:hypothetical protein GEMRC1_000379 [Eukaryota sp. GEM-RC1]